jgi:hypothetical protein
VLPCIYDVRNADRVIVFLYCTEMVYCTDKAGAGLQFPNVSLMLLTVDFICEVLGDILTV